IGVMVLSSNQTSAGAAVLNRRVRGQLIMLAISFLLGTAVNLIGLPNENSGAGKATTSTLLGLHILISVGLLVGAALCIWRSGPLAPPSRNQAVIGGALIVITIVAGVLTLATESNWWSYLMAVGFIGSVIVYGNLLLRTRT